MRKLFVSSFHSSCESQKASNLKHCSNQIIDQSGVYPSNLFDIFSPKKHMVFVLRRSALREEKYYN
ncbi:hypothetical protein QR98_0069460 [Sarcoptes scabiei]|uniref:Uncharacterized protein n=1 Tax=Sarcoptes scabiei TaxID=52283 RepID=A0A132AC35_SARSC|nr:hypothetical protein QR98_0069460 [Sarcoptes scabiei]